ncbi:hypothetical protein S40288_08082 [Stachybotrys chartarum IBT 40288]|nr:hypothetical protein S40288_08082 [Stachybotrys chartarum IBT 40288]
MGHFLDRLRRRTARHSPINVHDDTPAQQKAAATHHGAPAGTEQTHPGEQHVVPRHEPPSGNLVVLGHVRRPQSQELTVSGQAPQIEDPSVQAGAPRKTQIGELVGQQAASATVEQHGANGKAHDSVPSDLWSAAYKEAVGQVDQEIGTLVRSGRNLEELFQNLNEANELQKDESILRRGMERIKKPMEYLQMILNVTSPAAGMNPASSVAFGVVQSVATLAIGVCGVEERLNQQITRMLEHIDIIDGCDALAQRLDAGMSIHMALVVVYKDLLLFYHAVLQVLTKKSVALAMMSEQLNERVPPVVEDFLHHSDQLRQHISNATSEVVKNIEKYFIDAMIQTHLGSQKITQRDTFHLELTRKTAPGACQWLIEEPTFRAWYNNTITKPLVIYGDMGCGKTVSMSFLIEHVQQLIESQIPHPMICYHYCRDDETGNDLYIFSSLLQQLMHQQPRLKVQFFRWLDNHPKSRPSPTQDPELLTKFFFDSAKDLGRPLYIVIDGLDECENAARNRLIASLKDHSAANPKIRVCLSSRYRKEIQDLLVGSSEIRIRADSSRDSTIVSHLVKKQLSFEEDETRDFVISRLSELAKGSAIWIQMAVDLLQSYPTDAPGDFEVYLRDDLPKSELSDLYAKLFSQVTQNLQPNKKTLTDALEILAVAERPLSITELGWAVAQRGSGAKATTVQSLKKFVSTKKFLGFISPFISNIDFEAKDKYQIRLAHQSIRQMVLQTSPMQWAQLRDSDIASDEVNFQRRSELHGMLVRACVRYCLMPDLEDKELFTEEQDQAQTFDDMPGMDVFDDEEEDKAGDAPCEDHVSLNKTEEQTFDPSDRGFGGFFTYASCYWLHHLRRAKEEHGLALSDILALTTAGTRKSQNWWDQYYRPDCTLKPDESQSRPGSLETLSIVFVFGSETLALELLGMLVQQSDAESVLEQKKNAVDDLIRLGELHRLPLLISYSPDEDLKSCMDLFGKVMRYWAQAHQEMTKESEKRFEAIFNHMAGAFGIMVQQEWGNHMLCLAASYGCIPMLRRLFTAAALDPELKAEILRSPHRDEGRSKTAVYHQSVGDAAWNGHGDTVAFLLEQDGIDAHLHYVDIVGNNVFHKATRYGDVEMFRLLVSRFPEGVNHRNNDGDTPLQMLVFQQNNHEVVKFLLEVAHADVRCGFTDKSSDWHEPLRMATRYGDLAMCQTLVEIGGADPMSVFEQCGETLKFKDPLDREEMAGKLQEYLLCAKR